jgi:hypothetical protein
MPKKGHRGKTKGHRTLPPVAEEDRPVFHPLEVLDRQLQVHLGLLEVEEGWILLPSVPKEEAMNMT